MKFTYYTIIGKDLNLFRGHVENIKKYAGFDRLTCEKQFLTIVYRNAKIPAHVTESILKYCQDNGIEYYVYDEPNDPSRGQHDNFIHNLYRCWNLGYEKATGDLIFRGGSDQVFSYDSFPALYNAYMENSKVNKNIILQANTIENLSMIRQIGADSRHILKDFGNSFADFNYKAFEDFLKVINNQIPKSIVNIHEALLYWQRPKDFQTSLGVVRRCDGCSWLMTKEDYEKFGPIPVFESGYTGDVVIHDKFQKAGYKDYIVKDCVTYHFVRGESKTVYG